MRSEFCFQYWRTSPNGIKFKELHDMTYMLKILLQLLFAESITRSKKWNHRDQLGSQSRENMMVA